MVFPIGWGRSHFLVFSAENTPELSKICESDTALEAQCKQGSVLECRQLLKECRDYYEQKISLIENDITRTEKAKKTLQNKIDTLRNEIRKFNLQIRQSNIVIDDLSLQIEDTENSIKKNSVKIDDLRQKLAETLQSLYEEDQKSPIEALFSGNTLSDFFDNLMDLEILSSKNKNLLEDLKTLKSYLSAQKQSLDEEKSDLEQTVKIQSYQRLQSIKAKTEKEYYLRLTEKQYQEYLARKKKNEERAAEIKARIWKLIGVRKAPTYKEAVEVAEEISKTVKGVRPAFLLAILTQESRIGKDVGQCYLKDKNTGMGVKFSTNQKWPRVMKPAWIPDFLETIKEINKEKGLNLDPYATPISCWIPACVDSHYRVYGATVDSEGKIHCQGRGKYPFGWGGAMGPAQLMPFNWIGKSGCKKEVEAITGGVADPWDFYDSTLGAALQLKEDCHIDQIGERRAAACYFGGWGNRNTYYHLRVYADPVLRIAKCHQQFIDTGSMSDSCQDLIF